MNVRFGDHDLRVEQIAGPGGAPYWTVSGPRILRGGRLDSKTYAYYGTVHVDGKINAYGGRGEAGRHYKYALEEVLRALVKTGKARNVAGERRAAKDRKEEERTGSFIVKLSTGKKSRFHEFKRGSDWAEEMLRTAAPGTRAEFFRSHVEGAKPLTGSPFDKPFHVLEKDEHGHIRMGSIKPRAGNYRGRPAPKRRSRSSRSSRPRRR